MPSPGISTNGLNGGISSEKRPKTLCLSETVLQNDGRGETLIIGGSIVIKFKWNVVL